MAIRFAPKAGVILLCDFSLGGFKPPEMIKRRPVVVVSPKLPERDLLATVVPFSTTPPRSNRPYVVAITLKDPLPAPFEAPVMWAKCDMICAVSLNRLDLFRSGRDGDTGKRRYYKPALTPDDFERVRRGILAGLGLDN
ncbi:MAG: type II toxin-antitoxin system PemK/MazF family toxin [Maricaulaceae bacterium]